MLNNKKGFSLIELLVVIAIIGMLAATVLVSLGTARAKGRDAKRIADLKNIELALQLYADSHNSRVPLSIKGNEVSGPTGTGLVPDYIKKEPRDPSSDAPYGYVPYKQVPGNNSACLKYHLGAALENRNQVNEGDSDFNSSNETICGGVPGFDGKDTNTDGTQVLSKCGMGNVDEGNCYDLTN